MRGHDEWLVRLTGFLFSIKTRPVHIGYYGTDWGVNERFTSSERTEIPPLAMADYRPVFANGEDEACQVLRGPTSRIRTSQELIPQVSGCRHNKDWHGWMDVRFPDDIEKLWAVMPHKRGPAPKLFELIKTKMRAYDRIELAGMKIEVMVATFGSSSGTCRAARAAVLAEK